MAENRVLHLVRDGALAFEIPGYRILRELGHGGMATVYLAEQTSLKREVALKVLEPARAADPAFNERFLREGRIAANLHHRHIVAIHDLGVHGGRPYLAMDYLPKGSIADLAGQFAPAEALRCVREIAGALDLAHRHGIIHRDVKPENILRHEDGSFLLGDFGIARDLNASTMTVEGSALGTPSYMSPEQWRNERVDGRADLYSLGIVLFQLLTGRVPYSGTDGWSIGMQHMGAPVPLLPANCLALQPLLHRMLAKKASERIASGAEVVAAIAELERSGQVPKDSGAGADTAAAPQWSLTSLAKLFEQPRARAPARWPYAAFAGVLLLALLVFGWRSRTPSPPPAAPAKAGATVAGAVAGGALVAAGGTLGAIAVLPCVGELADQRFAHYGEGLAEELIHRLGRLRSLPVIGRTSSFAFKGSELTAGAIGRELGAEHVLACTVRETGDGLRIGAELVVSASDTQRWSGVYETAADAALTAVDQIAVGIAETLLASLVGSERALLAKHSTGNREALELYWQSVIASNEWLPDSGARARNLAEQAIALDPQFALAHVALAHAWINEGQSSLLPSDEVRVKVEGALDAALAIDPDLAEAHALRGSRLVYDDLAAARRSFERALLLQPNSVLANQFMFELLYFAGPREAAIEYTRRARDLDPRNPHLWTYHVAANFHAFRYEEAEREAGLTMRQFPEAWVPYWMRSWSLQFRGRCAEAIADAERADEGWEQHPDTRSTLGAIYACAGRPADAERILAEFANRRADGENIPWMCDALVLAALGRADEAHAAAERSLAQHDWRLPAYLVSQWWEPLHTDPRFPELLRKARVPEEALRAYREARQWRAQFEAQEPTKESDDV